MKEQPICHTSPSLVAPCISDGAHGVLALPCDGAHGPSFAKALRHGTVLALPHARQFCAFLAVVLAASIGRSQTTPPPIDPQKVEDQDDMTWDDYHPIPGIDWADPSHVPQREVQDGARGD